MPDKFHDTDIIELAAHIVGLDINDDYELEDIEQKLYDNYNVDMETFGKLINDLAPLMDMAVSPLTEEPFIGFGTGKFWIAKKSFKSLIDAILQWMHGDEVKSSKINGFERTITAGGKPEFKIYLVKADADVVIKKKEVSNPVEPEENKYLVWNRQFVGNSLLFHREGKAGYTTDIDKAHRFTFEEAMSYSRGSDNKVIPLHHCQEIATKQVHADHLDRDLIGKEVTNA